MLREKSDLQQKVLRTINKYNMLEKGDKVLVAVSGGPDSVTLLDVLFSLRSQFNLKLHVFHLNHKMRGKLSDGDATFVRNLAGEFGLPATVLSYDVPGYIKDNKLSPEEGARKVRYELLEEAAKKVKADKIALGHNQDDQVETFLMRILKGAGKEGLTAIPPVRESFIRPLIEVERGEVENYCKDRGLEFRIDASNEDVSLLRNRIRRQLLPILKNYNPNLNKVIVRVIDIIQQEEEVLCSLVDEKYRQLARKTGKLIKFSIPKFEALPLAVRRRLLRQAIVDVKGDITKIEFKHIQAILDALTIGEGKIRLDLPGRVVIFSEYGNIVVARETELESPQVSGIPLQVPGLTYIAQLDARIEARFEDRKDLEGFPQNKIAYLDAERVRLPIFVRTPLPGDKFRPLGMKGTKKLQDFFVDEKVPSRIRSKVPIILSEGEIVWVAGMRVDDRFKVTDETKKVLILEGKFD